MWAGEGASLVTGVEGAGQVLANLVTEATELLARRPASLRREIS